ncbi:unnamed protein product [Cylicocyclus nassatus]|uniref:Uncharacterized protein n=1 Tax=Cylicocyclus nassatus TaxID=53992 RepID=A0AA36MEQ6_CYLNA|nr:unnamed protein product [Cylicocyclus nassatus]
MLLSLSHLVFPLLEDPNKSNLTVVSLRSPNRKDHASASQIADADAPIANLYPPNPQRSMGLCFTDCKELHKCKGGSCDANWKCVCENCK